MRYDWLWLSAAVEPATGPCVCLSLPALNHESFQFGIILGFRDASFWVGGSGLFGFGIQACMCDPLRRFHLLRQKGQLGQESQGTRLRDARRRAEALVGALEGLVVQNEFEGLVFQVCDAPFEVSNIHLNIACDEMCAPDVVALRVATALFMDLDNLRHRPGGRGAYLPYKVMAFKRYRPSPSRASRWLVSMRGRNT